MLIFIGAKHEENDLEARRRCYGNYTRDKFRFFSDFFS